MRRKPAPPDPSRPEQWKTRWGRMIEKKVRNQQNRLARTGSSKSSRGAEPRQIGWDGGDSELAGRSPSTGTPKARVVVKLADGEPLRCPECDQTVLALDLHSSEDYYSHVFSCRLNGGTDPLLPIVSLTPHPPPNSRPRWNSDVSVPQVPRRPSVLSIDASEGDSFPLTLRTPNTTSTSPRRPPLLPASGSVVQTWSSAPSADISVASATSHRAVQDLPPIATCFGPRDSKELPRTNRANRVNRLALQMMMRAKNIPHEGIHKKLTEAVADESLSKLNLADTELTCSDLAILTAVLAEHPSLESVEMKGVVQGDEFTDMLVQDALLDVADRNKKFVHVQGSGLTHRTLCTVATRISQRQATLRRRQRERDLLEIRREYEEWMRRRLTETAEFLSEETTARKHVTAVEVQERRQVLIRMADAKQEIHTRELRQALRREKQRARQELAHEAAQRKREVEAAELAQRFKLVEHYEGLHRLLLSDRQMACRRQLKALEEAGVRNGRMREQNRHGREALAKLMVEDNEEEERTVLIGGAQELLHKTYTEFESKRVNILFLEAQHAERVAMEDLEHQNREILDKDETDERGWILERRRQYLQMKEAERARAHDEIAREESAAREKVLQEYHELYAMEQREYEALAQWRKLTQDAWQERNIINGLLNLQPRVDLSLGLSLQDKPCCYFVHSEAVISEPPMSLSRTLKAVIGLPQNWAEEHQKATSRLKEKKELVQRAAAQRQKAHDATVNLASNLLPEPRRSVFNVCLEIPIVEPQVVSNLERLKSRERVKSAIKALSFSNPMNVDELSSEQLKSEKEKIQGGFIKVSAENPDDPVAKHLRFLCETTLDQEVDGVLVKDAGNSLVSPCTPPAKWSPPDAPPSLTAMERSVETLHTDDDFLEENDGKEVKVLLPEGQPRRVTSSLIQELLRSFRFYSIMGSLTEPTICMVRVVVSLLYDSLESFIAEGVPLTVEGSILVPVVLAHPFITIPEPIELDYVEGMPSDEVALIPPRVVINVPPTVARVKENEFQVMGGRITLSNFQDSYVIAEICEDYTPDDVLCFKLSARASLSSTGSLIIRDREKDYKVGELIRGSLPLCHEVIHGTPVPRPDRWFLWHIWNESNPSILSAETLKVLLRSLRFINTSRDPKPGVRKIRVSITDSARSQCSLYVIVDVLAQDNATEMIIPDKILNFRSSHVLPALQKYLSPKLLPLAARAVVNDIDTDRFAGGYLTVKLLGGTKDEGIAFCTDSTALTGVYQRALVSQRMLRIQAKTVEDIKNLGQNSQTGRRSKTLLLIEDGEGDLIDIIDEAIEELGTQQTTVLLNSEHESIIFQGRTVGYLKSGVTVTASTASSAEGKHEINISFSNDGMTSIAAVQDILRRLVMVSGTPKRSGSRSIEITLAVGPTVQGYPEQASSGTEIPEIPETFPNFVTEKLMVKHCPPLLTIPDRYLTVDYREGSGAQRLAPFDLVADKVGNVEHYNEGYIFVEIVEGSNDEDLLLLREDESIALSRPRNRSPPLPEIHFEGLDDEDDDDSEGEYNDQGFSQPPESEEDDGPDSERSNGSCWPPESPMFRARDRVRDAAEKEVRRRARKRRQLLAMARLEARAAVLENVNVNVEVEQWDITMGSPDPIGTLTKITPSLLHIQFKGDKPVLRRNVMTVLRNLTYTNLSSNPQVHRKVVRVTISDSPPTFSQCIVELNVLSVDNVTDVVVAEPRLRYIPRGLGAEERPLPLFPYEGSFLHDPDTSFFDGGSLVITVVGGRSRDDRLVFMSLEQQAEMVKEAVAGKPARAKQRTRRGRHFKLVHQDKKILLKDGDSERQVATAVFEVDKPACKITFAKGEKKKGLVPIDLASYIMNCICFLSERDLVKNPTKPSNCVLQLRVSDGENPVPGRVRIQVDCYPPCCAISSSFDLLLPAKKGRLINPFATIKVAIPGLDVDKAVQMGEVRVWIGEPAEDACLLPTTHNLFAVKDGELSIGNLFAGRIVSTGKEITITFNWASKMTARTLEMYLRNVGYTCPVSDPDEGEDNTRRIFVRITYDSDWTTCCTTVEPSDTTPRAMGPPLLSTRS
eukprot:Sspe_Gene.23116::Locus_8936_Transcript_1_1_Confidence_1.000_Length_6271::g.23116::m.23116